MWFNNYAGNVAIGSGYHSQSQTGMGGNTFNKVYQTIDGKYIDSKDLIRLTQMNNSLSDDIEDGLDDLGGFEEGFSGWKKWKKKLKGAVSAVGKVANNPLVKSAVGFVPGGSAMLQGVNMAQGFMNKAEGMANQITGGRSRGVLNKLKRNVRTSRPLNQLPTKSKQRINQSRSVSKSRVQKSKVSSVAKDKQELQSLSNKVRSSKGINQLMAITSLKQKGAKLGIPSEYINVPSKLQSYVGATIPIGNDKFRITKSGFEKINNDGTTTKYGAGALKLFAKTINKQYTKVSKKKGFAGNSKIVKKYEASQRKLKNSVSRLKKELKNALMS